MHTELLRLEAPYNYIYYGGVVGKQVATLITVIDKSDANGNYEVDTHSHPVVVYSSSTGQGVVWNNVEALQCQTVCSETEKVVTLQRFNEILECCRTNVSVYGSDMENPVALGTALRNQGIRLDLPELSNRDIDENGVRVIRVGLSFGADCESYYVNSNNVFNSTSITSSLLYFSTCKPADKDGLREIETSLQVQLCGWMKVLRDYNVRIEFYEDTSYLYDEEITAEEKMVIKRMNPETIIAELNKQAKI